MSAVLPGSTTAPSGERLEIPSHDPERLVILQYTSGSTSEPKGVMIPDRVLAANIDACCLAAGLPGQARQLDAVDQRLGWDRDCRPQLFVGAGHSCTDAHGGPRPVVA